MTVTVLRRRKKKKATAATAPSSEGQQQKKEKELAHVTFPPSVLDVTRCPHCGYPLVTRMARTGPEVMCPCSHPQEHWALGPAYKLAQQQQRRRREGS